MTPTDLETLRGLLEDSKKSPYGAVTDKHHEEALTALLQQHAALLADYERMREWILDPMSVHQAECATWTSDAAPKCTCGLDALRATLKGE